MVMADTHVSVLWPTGDRVVGTCSEVSVPTRELVSVGFLHQLCHAILRYHPGAKKESLASRLGSYVSLDNHLALSEPWSASLQISGFRGLLSLGH